jgi:TetR/AcrR family transcriptional regulator, regulator of cefoperazone and chloramphenicol sensitivity
MKARILASARKMFGEYSYSGTTTRMIAKDVGIDISTLYYHWGEKIELYEAVLTHINEEIRNKLIEIEKKAQGKSLAKRLDIAIDVFSDYLFSSPEVSNLILYGYFRNNKEEFSVCVSVTEYIADIAFAMGLSLDRQNVSVQAKAKVMALWNLILNFISGENFLRPMLDIDREEYVRTVRETLKFILIPAFADKNNKL